MSKGFPTYAANARKGESGVNHVAQIVSDEFKWIFKRNHQEHDFGIDGQIEIVQEDGSVTGQLIGVQIKFGSSFFKHTNRWGYVYRGELKHLNYLSNYPTMVLIIICNPDSGESFWAKFDVKEVEVLEGSWTLTIPFRNQFKSCKEKLVGLVGPTVDMLTQLTEYWELNKMIVDASFVLYAIDRHDVESKNTQDILPFFDRLRSHKGLAYQSQGKIEISISGYDDDPRELFEIKEVKEYIKILDPSLRNLFFFVRTDIKSHTLQLFATCVCDATWSKPQYVEFDNEKLVAYLDSHWDGLNEMTDYLEMSIDENKTITYAILSRLGFDTSKLD